MGAGTPSSRSSPLSVRARKSGRHDAAGTAHLKLRAAVVRLAARHRHRMTVHLEPDARCIAEHHAKGRKAAQLADGIGRADVIEQSLTVSVRKLSGDRKSTRLNSSHMSIS